MIWQIKPLDEEYSFKQIQADHTLFYRRDGTDVALFLEYVDDMIVTNSNSDGKQKLHSYLTKEFEMKNLKHSGIEVQV